VSDESKELVTVRMPVESWQGIVNGIEKWVGDSMSEIEILSDFEFVVVPPSWEAVSDDGLRYLRRKSRESKP